MLTAVLHGRGRRARPTPLLRQLGFTRAAAFDAALDEAAGTAGDLSNLGAPDRAAAQRGDGSCTRTQEFVPLKVVPVWPDETVTVQPAPLGGAS